VIFHAPNLALLLASTLSAAALVLAAGFGAQVLRRWDLSNGSAGQLAMERRTYLVSTALAWVMAVELVSLLLFIFNADRMAPMFLGAMCAVGTLNANAFGFPALMLRTAAFCAAALWLIVHRADLQGRDYPLTRFKFALVIALAPLSLAAAATQLAYFLGLHPDVITSCCSRLFVSEAGGLKAELVGVDPALALALLWGALAVVLALAAFTRRRGRGQVPYALAVGIFFVVAVASIVSALSPYIYERPQHHCPFCILKPEYGYIGYWLYLPLFAGTVFGLAAGLLSLHPLPPSMRERLPAIVRANIAISALLLALFALVALLAIARSELVLVGA